MNQAIVRVGASVVALGLAAGLASSPALAAVEDGTYGIWSAADPTNAPSGTLTFGNTAVAGASYTWTNSVGVADAYIETTSDKGDWVNASTTMGAIFGADGPSAIENMIILDSSSASSGTLAVTFDNAVPANYLAAAVIDIDSMGISDVNESDRVLFEAASSDGTDLTTEELNADEFNTCDVPVDANMPSACDGTVDTTVPTMTAPSATSAYFVGDLTQNNDGSTGWINPTKEVKNLNITWTGNDSGSTVRVVIAVKQDPKPELPNTGVDVTTGAISALVLGALGASALVATRRRNA